MFDKIWLSSPHMGDEEFSFVKNAFDANWIAPTGPDSTKEYGYVFLVLCYPFFFII